MRTSWAKAALKTALCATAAVLTACGGPTGPDRPMDPETVMKALTDWTGGESKVHSVTVYVRDTRGEFRDWPVLVPCTTAGECRLVAPDARVYTDLHDLVDHSALIKEGELVWANDGLLDPTTIPAAIESHRTPTTVEIVKDTSPHWAWYAGGGALLVAAAATVWFLRRRQTNVNVPADESSDASTPNGNDH